MKPRDLVPALAVAAGAALFFAGTAAAVPPPAPAASQEAPQEPAPTFPAEVEQVIVDVVVTDKKGHPVEGLTADDLAVFEDGKRQEIETFEAIALPVEPTPIEPRPPRISVNTAPEARRGRSFTIVFDDVNITPWRSRDAKGAVAAFLRNGVREGDYVTLIASSGDAWWTARMLGGREKLIDVAKRLEGRWFPDQGRDRMTDWEAMRIHVHRDRNVMARVYRRFEEYGVVLDRSSQSTAPRLTRMTEDPFVTQRAAEVYYEARNRNQKTFESIERALNGMATARGRKSLILISEGFVYDPEVDEFRQIKEASRRANTAIYFVNARGLDTLPADLTADFGIALPQVDVTGYVFQEVYEAVEGPESMASDSGGFTIGNTNDLEAGIQRIADESRAYYLLGYIPTNRTRDGAWRDIDVKLKDGKGLEVRARKGYYAPGGDETAPPEGPLGVAPAFQAALDSPWAEDDIPLRMTSFVGRGVTTDKAAVQVATEVDIRDLAFEETDGRFVGAVEILLVVTHRESGEFFRYDQKIDMNMRPETRERLNRVWYTIVRDFELQVGDHQAKMVVREPATGRVGSVIHEFEVPPLDAFRVSTPVVTDLYRPRPGGRGVEPEVVVRREFAQGEGVLCQFDVFGAAEGGDGMPRVFQGYEVRAVDGKTYTTVPATLIKPSSLGELSRVVAFPLQQTPPGDYEILLHFEDELGRESIDIREPFTVVPPPGQKKTAAGL